jgi:hypothetical protein
MKHRFLLQKLGAAILAVDITRVAAKAESVPAAAKHKSWADVEKHFLGLGATQQTLDNCHNDLEEMGSALLMVV